MNRPQLDLLRRSILAAGATLPRAVSKAFDEADHLSQSAGELPAADTKDIAEALVDALADGNDPLEDPRVVRLAVARTLSGDNAGALTYLVRQHVDRRLATTVGAHADALMDAIAKPGNTAGEALHAAHDTLGDVDLDDPRMILKRGPHASSALADARDALATLRHVGRAWGAIAALTQRKADPAPLRYAHLTLDQYEAVGYRGEPWAIVCAGARIAIASLDEHTRRRQSLDDDKQGRAQDYQAAHDAMIRRAHGF